MSHNTHTTAGSDVGRGPADALAAAVFGPWSALAAAMLAVVWSRRPPAARLTATAAVTLPEKT
jgi:hypothetical protein